MMISSTLSSFSLGREYILPLFPMYINADFSSFFNTVHSWFATLLTSIESSFSLSLLSFSFSFSSIICRAQRRREGGRGKGKGKGKRKGERERERGEEGRKEGRR